MPTSKFATLATDKTELPALFENLNVPFGTLSGTALIVNVVEFTTAVTFCLNVNPVPVITIPTTMFAVLDTRNVNPKLFKASYVAVTLDEVVVDEIVIDGEIISTSKLYAVARVLSTVYVFIFCSI